MPQVFEPTLVQVSQPITLNAGGAVDVMDFSLGNLEGLLVVMIEFVPTSLQVGQDNTTILGLSIDPNAVAPATIDAVAADPDLIAVASYIEQFTTSGSSLLEAVTRVIFPMGREPLAARNLTFVGFHDAATNVLARCRVSFKRVVFSQSELIGQIAVRR